MEYTPHNYQKYATDYILSHPVAAILLDMGLGKTVITLTAIAKLLQTDPEIRRVLVVAPLRVARDTWPAELEKWDHLHGLSCAVAVGPEKKRRAALEQHAQITIINREMLVWLISASGIPFDYDMVVLDELSSFKNSRSQRFRALLSVRPQIKRIVGLTGTPAPNGLMDLWAEFRLLDMGKRLGRFLVPYQNEFFVPDRRNGNVIYSYRPKPGAREAIYKRISDITMSMKSTDYLCMPQLILTEYPIRLSGTELQEYADLKNAFLFAAPNGEISEARARSIVGKLTQLANGAVYTEDDRFVEIHQRKLDALEDIIEAANGNPLLIAYWYRHDLERIRKRFDVREIRSATDFRDWNAGNIPVAVIHPASCGHGLNLQSGGNTLVWFGLPWSLELYQQTNARLYRQGQQSSTVVIQHIVAAGTIDEAILAVLKQKEYVQDDLIRAVRAEITTGRNSVSSPGVRMPA